MHSSCQFSSFRGPWLIQRRPWLTSEFHGASQLQWVLCIQMSHPRLYIQKCHPRTVHSNKQNILLTAGWPRHEADSHTNFPPTFIHRHGVAFFFFNLSSTIPVHCVLSRCHKISITAEFTYRWQINKACLWLGLWFLRSEGPIRALWTCSVTKPSTWSYRLLPCKPASLQSEINSQQFFCNVEAPKLSFFCMQC